MEILKKLTTDLTIGFIGVVSVATMKDFFGLLVGMGSFYLILLRIIDWHRQPKKKKHKGHDE